MNATTTYIDEATLREPCGWDGPLDLEPLERKVGETQRFLANDGSAWRSTIATRAITYVRRETGR